MSPVYGGMDDISAALLESADRKRSRISRRNRRAMDRAEYLLFIAGIHNHDQEASDLWYRLLQWRRKEPGGTKE